MSLTKKTMLVFLRVEMLGMKEVDREATKMANVKLQTNPDAGNYQKCKIHKSDIVQLNSCKTALRKIHKDYTRPWEDHWRMLPATLVQKYTTEIRAAKNNFNQAILDTNVRWPVIVANSAKRLGPLFKPGDYPFVAKDTSGSNGSYTILPNVDLSDHFRIITKMRPTPDSGHFIIDLEKETLDEIKNKLEFENRQNEQNSMRELWDRLYQPVKNMADICSGDKKVFKSLIGNVESTLDVLKDLNVANNIDLTNMITDVQKELSGFTPGQIKNSKSLKKKLGQKAEVLSDKMAGYMGSSPPN